MSNADVRKLLRGSYGAVTINLDVATLFKESCAPNTDYADLEESEGKNGEETTPESTPACPPPTRSAPSSPSMKATTSLPTPLLSALTESQIPYSSTPKIVSASSSASPQTVPSSFGDALVSTPMTPVLSQADSVESSLKRKVDDDENVPVHKQSRSNARRKLRRKENKATEGHLRVDNRIRRRVLDVAESVPASIKVTDLAVARGAYSGVSESIYGAKVRYTLERLLATGFRLIEWDGITPMLILDQLGRIIAALAGRPNGQDYLEAAQRVHKLLRSIEQGRTWRKNEKEHSKGKFVVLKGGVDYAQNQKHPMRYQNDHQDLVNLLLNNKDVERLACFQSSTVARWFPKLYKHYFDYQKYLEETLPDEHRNFQHSVFSSVTFSLGPDVWTYKHKDSKHAGGGQSSITAGGNFNPKTGGHIILWELKMVIEFPPAATIDIPSASITHSTIPVQPGEERTSISQFTSGSIFRWIDNGGRNDRELKENSPGEFAELEAMRTLRWQEALARYSTLEELRRSE